MYKHACVIDSSGMYKKFVLVINYDQQEQIQNYSLMEGESLVNAIPPDMRPYAGADGFIKPRWDSDTSTWIESATVDEISAWEDEHPNPDLISLEDAKAERIQQSKADLSAYLEAHPITWTDGEQYAITAEKQRQLTSKLMAATMAQSLSTDYHLTWNSTGAVCKEWTLPDLTALAFAIDQRVTALVTYQQTQEVAMQAAQTMEELEAVVVDYDSVGVSA